LQEHQVESKRAEEAQEPSNSSAYTFYIYRSMSYQEFPFGNVNAANLPGAMWYLSNEVLPRCPKRYNITQIKRFKVTYKPTPEMEALGMNFGVRYSYDRGKCTGSNTINLGKCKDSYDKLGYNFGCNNFGDHYPWPIMKTAYPKGVWYSLPVEGKCDQPTGARNCTWNWEDAGHVKIEEELEHKHRGVGYYCHGRNTYFWGKSWSKRSGKWRVERVKDAFFEKYPDMDRDLPPPLCDFKKKVFWHALK